MPSLDVSDWTAEQITEQLERLAAQDAEPRVLQTLSWLSAAERQLRDQEAADAARCAALRGQGLKGANRVRAIR